MAEEFCPRCGTTLVSGGTAIACGPKGRSTTIRLPGYCPSPLCQDDRDNEVLARMVARGVIDA